MSNRLTHLPPKKSGRKSEVVPSYEYDTLGAPFRVTLKQSVTMRIDPKTGEDVVSIPDPMGLLREVVRTRVLDPRKLSGNELKFIRQALSLPSNKMAAFLSCSPEHMSRCEAGERVLSEASERLLRLFAYCATLFGSPQKLFDVAFDQTLSQRPLNKKSHRMARDFISTFLMMKIEPWQEHDEHCDQVHYVFHRRLEACCSEADDDDWEQLAVA